MKRLLDILISGTALLLLSPVLVLIATAIKIDSPGPILYDAPRAGRGYRKFKLLKFRTMVASADRQLQSLSHLNQYKAKNEVHSVCYDCCHTDEKACLLVLTAEGKFSCEQLELKKKKNQNAFFKISNDPRITPLGKFLRNTSLDELPQLINVLRGDMSLVGNRPLPLYEAECLTTDQHALRFLGPAGITGLWQVTKRGRKGEMSEEERAQLDNEYARNHSLLTDIGLMFKTIPALLQKENV